LISVPRYHDVIDQKTTLPDTSPMMFITSDTPARGRRFIDDGKIGTNALGRWREPRPPPTSGETIIKSWCRSAFQCRGSSPALHKDYRSDIEKALNLVGMEIDRDDAD